MAKISTRRSISLNRQVYERVREFCIARGVSMSSFLEARIEDALGYPERLDALYPLVVRAPTISSTPVNTPKVKTSETPTIRYTRKNTDQYAPGPRIRTAKDIFTF